MSNHGSAANLKSPGGDARLDFTDLFVFTPSEDPSKTVLIMDSNPFMLSTPMTGPEFHPDAVYRINLDTDADAHADVAFSFTFSQFEHGTQTGTAWYATGPQARQPEPAGQMLTASLPVGFDAAARPVQAGPVRLFAGVRSDPFFVDFDGTVHGFQWTGVDTFAGKNIQSIALEVPNDLLGAGPMIGGWATISLRRDRLLVQMDRGGHPTINPFLNPDGAKDLYNARQPADDVANYLGPWSQLLQANSGYSPSPLLQDRGGYASPEQAKAAAMLVLPDILRYDRTQPAHYPNGRVPTDDVYSIRWAWLSNGKIPPTGLKPHDDLLANFPYLGPPNP
jgi:Domain of unknown function (DUF4331)